MNEVSAAPRRQLDTQRLSRGRLPWIRMMLSALLGVLVGGLLLGLVLGLGAGLRFIIMGWLVVPLFGLAGGLIGMRRARNKIARRMGATPVPPDHQLHKAVGQLAQSLGLPAPEVAVYPSADLNAFAAGSAPDNAVVAFSQGLLDALSPREIIAVAAHEMAHIANNDMRRMQFATSFQNTLTWYLAFSEAVRSWVKLLLTTLGEMLVMKLSRTREYWADATAAAIVGKEAMIAALRRLEGGTADLARPDDVPYGRLMIRAIPGTAFDTHPSIADRIRALEEETYISKLRYKD